MSNHFFAYMSRMKYIQRWGLMRNTMDENIQEHSLQVAMIAHLLAVIRNKFYGGTVDAERAALLAVYHEAAEVITGDLATPIKYFNPEIRNAYKNIEDIASQKLLTMIPQELRDEYEPLLFRHEDEAEEWGIVKAADKISAYIKCVEELKSGNNEFSEAVKSLRKEVDKIGTPEVEYFMANFSESFALTLDEMG